MFKKSSYKCKKCKKKTNHYLILGSKGKTLVYKCNKCGHRKIHSHLLRVKGAKPLLLLLLISLFFLPSCGFDTQPPQQAITYDIKIKVMDEEGNTIKSNYELQKYNNMTGSFRTVKKSATQDIYTLIHSKARPKTFYRLYIWDKDHYPQKEDIGYIWKDYVSQYSLKKDLLKAQPNITFKGEINKGEDNRLEVFIDTKQGMVKRPRLCFDYSLRVIDLTPVKDYIECRYVNYSYYPHNRSRYYLSKGQYRCTENDYIENCEKIEYNKCYTESTTRIIDDERLECYNTGKDIKDNYTFPITATTMNFFRQEYITAYLIDTENTMYNGTLRW